MDSRNECRRIAVATLYTPEIRAYARLSMSNKAAYCRQKQYRLIVSSQTLDPKRPPSWSKIKLVERHLGDYDWVFWTDADSLFMNWNVRLEQFVDSDADLVMTADAHGPCAGQFLIRNTPASIAFLEKVYRQDQFIHHYWWEQAAMHHLFKTDRAGVRLKMLPARSFNSYPSNYREGDFVVHCVGKIDKLAAMRRFAAMAPKASPEEGCQVDCPWPPDAMPQSTREEAWEVSNGSGCGIGRARLRAGIRRTKWS